MILVSPKRVFRSLLWAILGLSIVNLSAQFFKFFLGRGALWGITRLIDVDGENTIPAWYSSVILLVCSVLLALITIKNKQRGDRFRWHWLGLSVLFLFFSMDEAASIHELLVEPTRNLLNTGGYLYFAWVLPGIGFILMIGALYWKFLLNLPTRTRYLFVLAAVTFIGGSIGMEMISGNYLYTTTQGKVSFNNFAGWSGMTFAIITTIEEALEMIGVSIFVYALLDYMSRDFQEVKIVVRERPETKLPAMQHHK